MGKTVSRFNSKLVKIVAKVADGRIDDYSILQN